MPQDAAEFLAQPPEQTTDASSFLAQGAPQGFGQSKAPPAQLTGPWRLPAMLGSAVVGATEGVLGLPGDVSQLARHGLDWLTGMPDNYRVPYTGHLDVPSSSDLQNITEPLGLTNRPDLVPQTPLEKYSTAGVSGVTTGLELALTGGGGAIPMTISGFTGGEAGEAAHQFFPNSKWAPGVAAFFGGLGANSVVNWVNRAMTAKKAVQRLDQASKELDMAQEARHYGLRAGEERADGIIAAAKEAHEAKQEIIQGTVKAAQESTDQLFNHVAEARGQSKTLQEAGESLQSSARNWISEVLPAKIKSAWAPVDAAIPQDMPLQLTQFTNVAKEINADAGALEKVAKLFKPAVAGKVEGALEPGETLEDLIAETPKEPQQYTWKDVARFRSILGDALANSSVIRDIGAKNLDRLYASLTADMSSAADRAGASDLFNAANLESRRLYNIAEGPVAKLVAGAKRSADDPAAEQVASRLLSGGKKGATDLQVLRAEIPEGVDELAAAHLRQPSQPWGKLSPEAQAALVPDAEQHAALNRGLAARVQAEEDADRALLVAKRDHAETTAAAREAKKSGDFTLSDQVFRARRELEAARAAVPPPRSEVQNLFHRVHQGVGAAIGYNVAPTLLNHLGVDVSPLSIGALSATGLALPYLGRSLRDALRTPARPLAATVAGSNPLALEPRK